MRRVFLALLVLPLACAGTLVAHAVAYALAGGAPDAAHGYLAHLPQLVVVVALPALLLAAVSGRAVAPRAWPVAAVALGAFVLQEHVERLAHSGELPFLLDRPVFLLGLVLQVPFAVAAWLFARAFAGVGAAWTARRPRTGSLLLLAVPRPPASTLRAAPVAAAAAPRGPPTLLPAR
jgi:hypothetical protein